MGLLGRNINQTLSHWITRYGLAVISIAAATLLRTWLAWCCDVKPAFITFYPGVMLVALGLGVGPGVFATFASALCADYFFIEPTGTLTGAGVGDQVSLVLFLVMGLMMCSIVGALHRAKLRERAARSLELTEIENRFQTFVAGVREYAIYALDPEGRIVSWNSGAERIKGWSESEVLGRDYSIFYPRDDADRGAPRQHLRLAAANGTYSGEGERVRKDGTRFWAEVALTALRSPDGTGAVRGFIKITHDISERRLASQAMAESRSQMARILESAMDAIITVDTDQRVTLFNAAAVAMFRCTLDEALGAPLERFIPQRYRAAHAEHIRAFAEIGTTSRAMGSLGTLYGVRSNGEEFPIEASISQVEVSGRKVFTVILRDITERERAEGQQSLLLHELAHRVKNSLAVVQSIAAQTRRFALPEQFDATFDARLRALGASHDLLTQSEWEGATLADVVSFSLKPYGSRAQLDRWTTAGPDIWLFPNEAVTLGLAFHELATNAAKFGALSNATGTIAISWDVKDDDQPGSIEIKWLESGGPPVQPPSRKGFGSTLLDRALAHELSGTALLCFAPEGFVCTLCFPLSQKVKLRT